MGAGEQGSIRTYVEYVANLILTGLCVVPQSTGRPLRDEHVVVRPLLLCGDRVLCSAEMPRATSYSRLSTETTSARGDHLQRAVCLLARSPQSCRRLRSRVCSGGTCWSQYLPLDDTVSGNDGQSAVIHAGIRRRPVLHDYRRNVCTNWLSGLHQHFSFCVIFISLTFFLFYKSFPP